MLVINDSTPLRIYYGEVIYLPHHNRTVITTYSTYIHHTIHATKSKGTKRPPSSTTTTTTTTSKTTTESCNETKRSPSSAITSERLNRLRLKRQVSVHSLAYIIGVLNQAICIAPFDPLGAGIPTRMYESPVCRANLDSPRPKPQDYFSVRRLDDRTDGVSRYRGKTMSFQRNTLSASLYIGMA